MTRYIRMCKLVYCNQPLIPYPPHPSPLTHISLTGGQADSDDDEEDEDFQLSDVEVSEDEEEGEYAL